MKILIVDDTPTNLKLLRAVLQGENFEIVEAPDGVQALAVLDREPIDAIISDILMPNMDGYRLCEEVRRSERFYHLPFIVYTSTYNSPADERLATDMGADKYIKKPAPIKEITDALSEIMRREPRRRPQHLPPQKELSLAKLYNEALVNKLEQKNQELSAQTEVLRASEEKFRQMAESINEVLWITHADMSAMLYVSPSYETVWGRTCRSLYEKPRSFIEAIHEEDRPGMQAALNELSRGEKFDREYRVVRPDGQIRWVHARGTAIPDWSGVPYRLVGIAEDITKRKDAEQKFRQAQKMEAVGQLAGGVAHDFNNLLMVIQINLELVLMKEKNLGPESKDHMAGIAHAADRAGALTRQLLTFSRSQAMQMQLLDLNDLSSSFAKMLRRIVGENIRVKNDYAPKLPPIKGDPGMIEQVLMNLAINARDAMPGGGQLIIGTDAVEIDEARAKLHAGTRAGAYTCLSVRDTGTGIAPENMHRIFEPFFTTKGVGKGTGLGLATVFGIAEQHNGWVEVSSQLGVGTTFRVYFPATSEVMAVTDSTASFGNHNGHEKILLVEDETIVRAVVLQTLENHGYSVVEADSASSAQKIWGEQGGNIDLLIADVVMPGGQTGLDLVEILRVLKPELKVLLTSGYSADLAHSDLAHARGITLLQKPFSTRVLAETVRKCLASG
jgi:two-component system, cell cycle sensor histidine kinase and response regulator CckA